jgi:hypothetical protein
MELEKNDLIIHKANLRWLIDDLNEAARDEVSIEVKCHILNLKNDIEYNLSHLHSVIHLMKQHVE